MTDPLFVADLATLKSQLRLSAVPASATDTEAIIDQGILNARIRFNRRLGETRVGELVALPFVTNPLTEDEILRALANQTETQLVYCWLLRHLPHAWMDTSGSTRERWNEEAPFRETGSSDVARRIASCENEIEESMQLLDSSESLGDEETIQTFSGTPANCPGRRIGQSLRGSSRRIFNDPA